MTTYGSRFMTILFLILVGLLSGKAIADPSLPWDLRNHYRIPIEEGVLIYAEDNAEWRVLLKDETVLADSMGFSVVLADGTELNGLNLGEGKPSRDAFTHVLGDGTTYSVTFEPKNGLKVSHVMRTFKSRPFVFVEILVENVGTSDVAIERIYPVVAKTSVMQQLSPQTRVRYRSLQDVGGQPVVVGQEQATMAVIHDPTKPICFGVGLLPGGLAESSIGFTERDGEWHGELVCKYGPAKVLAPGEKLLADPLWMSHGVPEPHRVDLYYCWAYSMFVESPERNFLARGWYTLDDTQGLDEYVAASTSWKQAGIDHVLLSRGWEGRPGSMSGAAGRFPKNMKSAIGSLISADLNVGVSIDPLVAKEGGNAWTTESSDGQSWINPLDPGASAALAAKVKTLSDWGAAFIVVEKSMIPEAALAKLKLTRAEAQNAAYKALRVAAAPIPVFPASSGAIQDNVDDWLDASGSVARMAMYGVIPAPLQCRMGNSADISDDLATAASLWPGPIEFHGRLSKRLREDISGMITRERVQGQPMDDNARAPRNWNVVEYDENGTVVGERTVTLGGSASVKTAQSGS